ncbi:hypothetical protein [Synechococcus sp. H70.2]|uniref:hypothetical protein n=1 Tax=unclassified Synechococcus TaxID=2626047 RepID=UPI0039C05257
MAAKRILFKLACFLLSACLVSIASTVKTSAEQAFLNAEYLIATSPLPDIERVRFQDGKYQRGSSIFEEGFLTASLERLEPTDLNNDGLQDVVAVAASSTGGSAAWISLSGLLGGSKNPTLLEPVFLGDRVVVNNISIARSSRGSAEVCLDMLVHGPKDAQCCPTKKEKRCFTVAENRWIPRRAK